MMMKILILVEVIVMMIYVDFFIYICLFKSIYFI
jgi:hypothetical protein